MIDLNDVLEKEGIDPSTTMVMRHRPTEATMHRALRRFAVVRPDVYDEYQRCQSVDVENAVCKTKHLVSLVGLEAKRGVFVAVYRFDGYEEMSGAAWMQRPAARVLLDHGDPGPDPQRTIKRLKLTRMDTLQEWSGRLVLRWPPPERSWWRWAARNTMAVETIHPESVLTEPMPEWSALVLSWTSLQDLPPSWEAALGQWRGIYAILDRTCGQLYVGSAYGEENLLARWRGYAKSGHGGNVELKGRDPKQFQFSILQRVSPDLPADEVIRVEASWKERLGTREFGLNGN